MVIQFLIALLLFSEPTVRQEIRRFKRADRPDVAFAYKTASPLFRDAITTAYQDADPEGAHPDWEFELWKICHRETWCGRWGIPSIHAVDAHLGPRVYRRAVRRGTLNPDDCPEHRVGPEYGRTFASFSTRGGWGQIAAGTLHRMGQCTPPEALDDPYRGAANVLDIFQDCKRWDGDPGARFRRSCTCEEHTAIWVGVGRWRYRNPLERWRSVSRQCGPTPLPGPWPWVEYAAESSWRLFRRRVLMSG